jgi:putative phosphoesterase
VNQVIAEDGERAARSRRQPELAVQAAHEMTIGVIADTHGYLDSRVRKVFSDVEIILHAGDVGSLSVIQQLERIAPVVAVRGNMDRGVVWRQYPATRFLPIGGKRVLLVHKIADSLRPISEQRVHELSREVDVVVFGHTHRAESVNRDGVLYLNPGSAGVQHGSGAATVGIIRITEDGLSGEVIRLV